jgi:hypothetical protein
MSTNKKLLVITVSVILTLLVSTTATSPLLPAATTTTSTTTIMHAMAQTKTTSNSINGTPNNPSPTPLIQQRQSSAGKSNVPIENNNVLLRGIISSEPGQPEQLKVQRTIILPHRQDGKDYTGLLTFTATKPVEVLFGHRLFIDNKTLSRLDAKKFGNLFLVTPIHPNVGYVLSAPTVIKPNYNGSAPPYYAASLPFVASSVVLRTLGGIPFIAVYEVNAHIGQPQGINNVTTAMSSNTINTTK